MPETCFVIMPIGTQQYNEAEYTDKDLREKYNDLIRESILKIKPELQIFRADEISMPGSITNDIFSRLMYSRYVIADISLPNPNVFYELGIRHAIRAGTILIKDRDIKSNVFDISHLRHIEYSNTPSGLKELSESLARAFSWIDANPNIVDNQFLELASFIKFKFPYFVDVEEEKRKRNQAVINAISPFMKRPELMSILISTEMSQEEKNRKVQEVMIADPNIMLEIFSNLLASGIAIQK